MNSVSYDRRSYERRYAIADIEAWKSQDFNGVWTNDLVIQVRRSKQLRNEANDAGRWSLVDS